MFHPQEQERPDIIKKREEWVEKIQKGLNFENLIPLDESSLNLAYTRLYGRAKSNKRVKEGIKDVRFQRQSILSTIRLNGEMIPFVFEGTLNKELFSEYVRKQLAPSLDRNDVVLLDNSSVHHAKLVIETFKECGINALYLPPYSPDINPNDLMWAYIKAILRKLKARTLDKLNHAINTALNSVTPELIKGWFKHCGYS